MRLVVCLYMYVCCAYLHLISVTIILFLIKLQVRRYCQVTMS
jgi:hypothetical protein